MCDLLVQMINRYVPIPAAAHRRRRWVRVGQELRFPSGLLMAVQCHAASSNQPELRLHWHFGHAAIGAFTCYEPVRLSSDHEMLVTIRAVALRGAEPMAVLVELGNVTESSMVATGWAA